MSGFGANMLPTALGRRSRLLWALCLVLMVVVLQEGEAAPALPDGVIGSADLRYLAIFAGQCRFKMPKGGFPCDSRAALLSLRNGRSLLAFSRGEILYHLSGGHDRQPNPENYYLSIDSLGIQSRTSTLSIAAWKASATSDLIETLQNFTRSNVTCTIVL